MSGEQVVQRQVDAYNARDIDAFCACFSSDVTIYDFPDTLLLKGYDQLRERYTARFAESPDLKAKILQRFVTEQYVVDIEDLSGSAFGTAPATVIYQIDGNLITFVWFIRSSTI